MTDETAEKLVKAIKAERSAANLAAYYDGSAGTGEDAEKAVKRTDKLIERLAAEVAELRAQVERLAGLNDVFLNMRDRVSGYVSAPPLAHFFQRGGNAFEWAATSVRRAAAGEPPLVPPVPIRELGDDDSTEDGYRHRVLTCEVCGKRFVCVTEVRIDHQVFDNDPTYVYHHGRPLDKTGDNQ